MGPKPDARRLETQNLLPGLECKRLIFSSACAGMIPLVLHPINRALAVALLILLPFSFAGARRTYLVAEFLDYSETSPCHHDCQPFDRVYFNFCFRSNGQVLTARSWAWSWEYDPSKMASLKGNPVQIRYDNSHVWVIRTDGKELRLTRARAEFENPVCKSSRY